MTRNALPAHTGWAINRGDIALRLIQLGDNMRLRADLGQTITDAMVNAYNDAVYQWEHPVPRQRQEARR